MPRTVLAALGVGLAYAALYMLIVVETSFGTSVGATFWPGAGVTASVLILRPRREWPFYLTAVGLAEFYLDANVGGFTVPVSAGMAVANCVEPLLAAGLLRRWLPDGPDLSRLRHLFLVYAAAAVAGPLLGATVGSVWPWLIGPDPIWPRLGRWYIGDALGVIVIAPLIISVLRPPGQRLFKLSQVWTFGVLFVVSALALPWRFASALGLPFMVIPTLALVGMRLGTRAAAAGVLFVGVTVEITTALGVGPFTASGPFTGLLAAQMYVATCSLTALMAAALMTDLVSRDEMALHDSLTGLPNRRLLFDRIAVTCSHLDRRPGTVAVVFVDLDGFKHVNDRHGHAAGDQVLIETARRLQAVIRDEDTVARLGGDEFVIVIDRISDIPSLRGLVDRLEHAVCEPIADEAGVLQVGASIGYTLTESDAERPETLLARADAAMYEVKQLRAADQHDHPMSRLSPGPELEGQTLRSPATAEGARP